MKLEHHPDEPPSIEEFTDWFNRNQYAENPKKLANYDCCAAIFKTMAREYEEIKFGTHPLRAGLNSPSA